MNIKNLTLSGVLFAAGLIIHQLVPPIFGVTPDVQLAVLFIVMLINKSFKGAIAAGFVSGIITALTTKFPGGQIPNFIDKMVSTVIMYFILVLLIKIAKVVSRKLEGRNSFFPSLIKNIFSIYGVMAIVGLLGTMLSGTVFLTSALYIVGLPSGLTISIGFFTSVLPAAIINIFLTPLLYKVVERSARTVNFSDINKVS